MNSNILYKLRLMLAYRDAVRTRVPFLFNRMIANAQRRADKAAKRLKDKEKIEVAFLLTIPGMWKVDYLFRRMAASDRYHPYIVIFPYSHFKGFDEAELWETVRRTETFVKERGFEYIIPYDEKKKKWQDIRKTLNPDIVFFTTPYRDIMPQYYYYHFKDKYTCYVPYAIHGMDTLPMIFDQIAINLYGINFEESSIHAELAKQHSRSKGRNFTYVGYAGTEVYLRDDYVSPDVWKPQSKPKKRIIWAPHHTIDGSDDFQVSTFLLYYDEMLRLAEKTKDELQFAFKPHQLLKFKLMKLWGKERTAAYYRQWAEMENTQLEEAGYVDLFIHSDAMIHDSVTFTTEYMFQNKPVMYLVKDDKPREQFNLFGVLAFDNHYQGHNMDEVKHFLQEVVLEGNDPMKAQRSAFYDRYLKPADGVLPSEKIIQTIEAKICQQAN